MSCPYLEKGWTARCHAFNGGGVGLDSLERESICFSGEFSDCPFLFTRGPGEPKKSVSSKAWVGIPQKFLTRDNAARDLRKTRAG